jgi:EmrB/QacA subfamily drug resistance transporter
MSNVQSQTLPATLELRRWLALPVLLAGTFMVILDFFIVNVAIPSLQRELNADAATIEWIVAGYGLTYAAGLIIGGRLGDLYGRRRIFALGLAVFTFASAGCGWAPDAALLIVARAAQGAGAALLAPQVLAIIGVTYTGADRGRAFAVYGVVLGLASACGQVVGGLLIRADLLGLGWRGCFLVNIPIGVAALLLAPSLVPESRAPIGRRLDGSGVVLITLAITALLLPLIEGRRQGWPTWTWLSLAAAVALFGGFVYQQRRHQQRRHAAPLIDPAMFRVPRFRIGLLAVLALFGGVASFFLVLALYLQQGRGLDALAAGLMFTTLAGAFSAASLVAGRIARRLGRPPLVIGALGMAAGLLGLRVTVGWIGTGGSPLLLLPALLLDGAGMGLVMAPLVANALAGLPARDAGAAAGVLAAVQQFANALGVALIGLVFFGVLAQAPPAAAYATAFGASLDWLVGLALVLAVLARIMVRRRA